MRPRLSHIKACMADHAACTRRARACLQAACALSRDNAALVHAAIDEKRLAQMTRALVRTILDADAHGEEAPGVRPVLTDAVTPKGEMCLIAENAQARVIRLCRPEGMDVTRVLQEIRSAAQTAGYAVEEHLSPLMPGQLLHLTIPGLHTLVTTSDALPSEQIFDFAACIPQGALLRSECALEQGRASVKLHIHRAAAALSQAKQLHDELETFYVPNMDFAAWQRRLDATLESL